MICLLGLDGFIYDMFIVLKFIGSKIGGFILVGVVWFV